MNSACSRLRAEIDQTTSFDQKARFLAVLGNYERMLGHPGKAEQSHSICLSLLKKLNASDARIVAAQIRLAHALQWQKKFAEADNLFRLSIEQSRELNDAHELLSFALQHYGKSLFDQSEFRTALKCFYDAMMIRVKIGRNDLADSSRFSLDKTSEKIFAPPPKNLIDDALKAPHIPSFVAEVLNKNHMSKDLPPVRSNCINAALNFFRGSPYVFDTASTLQLIDFLRSNCEQVEAEYARKIGGLIVFWSRTMGGSWSDKKIVVSSVNQRDPDFPYGLVFEHIAVFINSDLIFHKPSPAQDVPYKIDYLETAYGTLQFANGFEATFHRYLR